MKRIISMILVSVMSLSMLTACSSRDTTTNADNNATNNQASSNNILDDVMEDIDDVIDDVIDGTDDIIDETLDDTKKIYQDGIYRAETKDMQNGYTDYVEITISDGEIKNVYHDGKDMDGNLKSEDEDLKTAFENDFDTYPKEYMAKFSDELVSKQKIDDISGIEGLETHHKTFKKLASEALNNAESGSKTISVVDVNL